jgi:hypothetical protein
MSPAAAPMVIRILSAITFSSLLRDSRLCRWQTPLVAAPVLGAPTPQPFSARR